MQLYTQFSFSYCLNWLHDVTVHSSVLSLISAATCNDIIEQGQRRPGACATSTLHVVVAKTFRFCLWTLFPLVTGTNNVSHATRMLSSIPFLRVMILTDKLSWRLTSRRTVASLHTAKGRAQKLVGLHVRYFLNRFCFQHTGAPRKTVVNPRRHLTLQCR